MREFDGDCTVLVASCDAYADLLGPFSALWRKHWPDCPFETVLVTETAVGGGLCFDRVVACGPGGTWCSRLVRALDEIASPYVLMLCDDYYLEAPVDAARFRHRLEQARRFDAVNLRLIPNPPAAKPFAEGLDEYPKQTGYCISTLAGIWNREFLRGLAEGKANIWEFERLGSFAPAGETRPKARNGWCSACSPGRGSCACRTFSASA